MQGGQAPQTLTSYTFSPISAPSLERQEGAFLPSSPDYFQ